MERQGIPLRQTDYLQNSYGQGLQYVHTGPNLPSLAGYNQSQTQVQRWANWIKLVSVFIIVKGLMSLASLLFVMASPDQNTTSDDFEAAAFAFTASFLAVGVVGYRLSISKYSRLAKLYIMLLIAHMVIGAILILTMVPLFSASFCDALEEEARHDPSQPKFECGEDFESFMTMVCFIAYVLVTACICTPVMCCPCKLLKHAKVVEKGVSQDFQMMPVHSMPYSPIGNAPIRT